MYFCSSFLLYFFLGNAVLKLLTHFHLVYCIFAAVVVCHFLCSLTAFDCQEIKGLLTYLLKTPHYSYDLVRTKAATSNGAGSGMAGMAAAIPI